MITWIESPREAMQSHGRIIPTAEKIMYIQTLMNAGFDALDVGSIVSPKFIPQMADTIEVLKGLNMEENTTGLMVLTASLKGVEAVAGIKNVSSISFPFSVSPTFQKKNINKTIEESIVLLEQIKEVCVKNNKDLVVYVPMAFGNPYQDPWDNEILLNHLEQITDIGIECVSFSNVSVPIQKEVIKAVFSAAIPFFPDIEFGLHLHTSQSGWFGQVEAAWDSGCRRFDTVISGLGGCPMSDELLGNLDTDLLLKFLKEKEIKTALDMNVLNEARALAAKLFLT